MTKTRKGYVKLSKFKLNERNPREISKDAFVKLCKSIRQFPKMMAIRGIVVDEQGLIIGGTQRYRACVANGMTDVPKEWILYAKDFSDEERRRFIIADNAPGGLSGDWNMDLLANEWDIDELVGAGFDEGELIGFDNKDDLADAEPQVDKAEELNKVWKVKSGDLWQIGEHRLACGDCTDKSVVDRVMGGEKADMVFTDPPYGIAVVKNNSIGGGGAFGGKKNLSVHNDNFIKANKYAPVVGDETTEAAESFYLLCKSFGYENFILWGGNHYTQFLPVSRGWICWDKIDGVEGTTKNFSDIELAWTSYDCPARIVRHRWQGLLKASEHNEKRCHPTQKPVALAVECFNLFDAGNIILDGFLGSGTTMVACENTGRKCRGIEISPAYCAVDLQRMTDAFQGIKIAKVK